MITNLEELVLECADKTARTGIEEAIKCYQSGAYRAAIVSAYVTVCFDLIEKLKALAAGGDGNASAAEEKLKALQEQHDKGDPAAIKGLLEFERGLLELFRDKFEFFGKNEFDELCRLREDRNRCAHPTFFKSALPFSPSAELTRLHIRNSLFHVLTQNPKQGKAALDSLETLVLSSYFPTKLEDAVTRLRGSELANARPALVRGFVDRCTFGAADKNSKLYKRRCSQVALAAAVEMHRGLAIPRLVQNLNKLLMSTEVDANHVGTVLALRQVEAGEQVDEAGRTVMKAWVKNPTPKIPIGNMICRGLRLSWLRETALEILKTAKTEDLANIDIEDVPREVVQYAAEMYCTAKSWAQANRFTSDFAIKFAPRFEADELRMIFTEAEQGRADLLGSSGFKEFLHALCSESEGRRLEVSNLLNDCDLGCFLPDEDKSEDA